MSSRGHGAGGRSRWSARAQVGPLHQLPVGAAEESAADRRHRERRGDPLRGEGQLSSWLPPVPSPDRDGGRGRRGGGEGPCWQWRWWRRRQGRRAAFPRPRAAGSQPRGSPLQPGPRQRHQRGEKAAGQEVCVSVCGRVGGWGGGVGGVVLR